MQNFLLVKEKCFQFSLVSIIIFFSDIKHKNDEKDLMKFWFVER